MSMPTIDNSLNKQEKVKNEIKGLSGSLTRVINNYTNISETFFSCEMNAANALYSKLQTIKLNLNEISINGRKNNFISDIPTNIKDIYFELEMLEKDVFEVKEYFKKLTISLSQRGVFYSQKYHVNN